MRNKAVVAAVAAFVVSAAWADVTSLKVPEAPFPLEIAVWTPPEKAFPITDFGAKADGRPITEALERAIDACAAAGGGRVVVPAGEWICGAFTLKSNVALVLDEKAVLHFPDDPVVVMRAPLKANRQPTMTHRGLINAQNCTNVAILGKGTFLTDVAYWHKNFMVDPVKGFPRPHFLLFDRCKNVRLEGFKIRNSPSWTLHLVICEDILLRGVDSVCDGPNTDGLDLDSCNRALVENCSLVQGDDTYTIKSGKDEAGRKRNIPCQNVMVRNCVAGGHVLLGIGSEVSGGVRNICMRDCTVTSDAVRMLYIKTNSRRGGYVENIWAENIFGRRARFDVAAIDQYYDGNPVKELGRKHTKNFPTRISGIHLRNIECGIARSGVTIRGDEELMPTDVEVSNVRIGSCLGSLQSVKNCPDAKVDGVRLDPSLLAKYKVRPDLGFALEWNRNYRTDVPYEVEIARGRMGWNAGMPGGTGFEVIAKTANGEVKPKVTMLPGKVAGDVRIRFQPPEGTLSLWCHTFGRQSPADPAKVDNLFAGVKLDKTPRVAVPPALAGAPVVFELTVRNTDANEAHGATFALVQYDANGRALPETVVDRRWTGHNYPAGNVSHFHEEGRLHPKAASVALTGATAFVKPVKVVLRAAGVLPFPKYDDANFAPGVSGAADDTALRLGGERRNAFWYQTRSHASWAGHIELRREEDIFFPANAGTVEAWFKSDWRPAGGAYTLFQGWQKRRADHGKVFGNVMRLTYEPKDDTLAFLIRDVAGKAFRGSGKAKLPRGVWTHLAAEWQPEGEAKVFVDGKLAFAFPVKGWTTFDLAKEKCPNDAHAIECFLGADYQGARVAVKDDPAHPFVDGWADSFRVSSGCRYAGDFMPARSFAADADTRALFAFDRSFDGVSGGGFAWIPGTFRSDTDRVDHVLDFGDQKVQYYPEDIHPANDPRYVFDIVNYPRTPSVADFEAARRPFRHVAELKVGGTLKFAAPEDAKTDFVEIANISDEPLVTPILLNGNDIDPRSENDLIETMKLGKLSPRQRANRIFQFVIGATDYFQTHSPMFPPSSDVPQSVEYEALRMLNGYCGFECGPLNNMTANLFVKVGGLPASITAGYGHEFEQVFFDGKNHIYDLSAQKFFPAMDNMTAAYLKEVADQPGAFSRMAMSCDHFIRLGNRAFWTGSAKKVPRVGVTLAPGESFRVWQVNDGQGNDLQTSAKKGLYRGSASPWRPDCSAETHADSSERHIQRAERYFPHYLNGFISFAGTPTAANVAFTNVTADSFCYRVESGYPIVWADYGATKRDGAAAAIEISTDGGATYRPLACPATYAVRARYAYLVRVGAPIGEVAEFRARTEVQLNPRVFPGRIRGGANAYRLKAASGGRARVTVQGRAAAGRIAFDGRVVHSGAVPGVELAFTAFDSAKGAAIGVTGVSDAATLACFGNVAATLAGGKLALRAKDPSKVAFGAVTVRDGGAEKTLTVLTGPNVRLATAADAEVTGAGAKIARPDATSPQARVVFTQAGKDAQATFRFDPLAKGRYAVLDLNRFRNPPATNRTDTLFGRETRCLSLTWGDAPAAKSVVCGRPRNDACNFLKATYNRSDELANFKWDYPYRDGTSYMYHMLAVNDRPSAASVGIRSDSQFEIECVAVLIVPDPDIELRADLVKLLCGLNADPARIHEAAVCAAPAVREGEPETEVEARGVPVVATGAPALRISAGAEWIPFVYRKNIEKGSALDFSGMSHFERPAGRHGRVIVRDGHFAFADSPDVPRRFWGCNINLEAVAPETNLAVEVAERLARTGYNAVRIHHHDTVLQSAEAMSRFDFFVAELVRRGIYLETDLFVSRKPVLWRDIGIDRDGAAEKYSCKALMTFYPPAYSNWCAFARNFLTHRNPYLGVTVAELPWINVSLVNEGRFVFPYPTLPKLAPFQEKWREWIRAKRAADPSSYPELGPKPWKYPKVEWKDQNAGTIPRAAADFCADLERAFVARARPFLASLGLKAPISNQNNASYYVAQELVRDETYDTFDIHAYGGGQGKSGLPRACSADNPFAGEKMFDRIGQTVFARTWSSPILITEWNFGWPNAYRPAGTLKTAALASLQDWGSVFRFAYTHGVKHLHEGVFKSSRFDTALDYSNLASERMAFALFARGDLKPLATRVALELDAPSRTTPENWAQTVFSAKWDAQAMWRAAWGVSAPGRAPADAVRTTLSAALGEGLPQVGARPAGVDWDGVRGAFSVATPYSAAFSVPNGSGRAGPLALDLGAAPGTAFVLSLDGQILANARRLLFSLLTDVQFDGIEYADATRTAIVKMGDYSRPLVRRVKAPVRIALKAGAAYEVWELATDGRRVRPVPTVRDGAVLSFTADTKGATEGCLNWEIVRL